MEAGGVWTIDRDAAAKVLTHFYPQTETCDFARDTAEDGPHRHRILDLHLAARAIRAGADSVLARLEGRARIKHTFYPDRDDDNVAEVAVAGYLEIDPQAKRVRKLRLLSETARYGRFGFKVAVREAE